VEEKNILPLPEYEIYTVAGGRLPFPPSVRFTSSEVSYLRYVGEWADCRPGLYKMVAKRKVKNAVFWDVISM
jgi:hypothetical protein